MWSEKFGRSNIRYQYNILGKPISDIHRILDIVDLIYKLNFFKKSLIYIH